MHKEKPCWKGSHTTKQPYFSEIEPKIIGSKWLQVEEPLNIFFLLWKGCLSWRLIDTMCDPRRRKISIYFLKKKFCTRTKEAKQCFARIAVCECVQVFTRARARVCVCVFHPQRTIHMRGTFCKAFTPQVFASINQSILGSQIYLNSASYISSGAAGYYLNPEQGASIAVPP